MADTNIKLSGTYDSIEAYNILKEMREMSTDYEEIKEEAEAAVTTATAAATTAQGHANNASTYADNAQTYAGNANTSAGAAAGSASTASTAASNAISSETAAAGSASAASTSETNAAASATAAAESAAEAAATLQNYLPVAGGTMTGTILSDTTFLARRNALDDEIAIAGDTGSQAPLISIRGRNRATDPGSFLIRATDGTNTKELRGKSDGTLTWAENNVATTNNTVNLTGNQTVAGTKTFSSSPIVPTPATTDNSTKVATTAYVKANVPASIGNAKKPVYTDSNGKITASNGTEGGTQRPVYLNAGTITACTATGSAGGLEGVDSMGSNWIRYSSGFQMCWLHAQMTNAGYTWTFPKAFNENPCVQVTTAYNASLSSASVRMVSWVKTRSSTNTVITSNTDASEAVYKIAFAFGKWK